MLTSDDSRTPALADRLREKIRLAGPITFHDWMQAALYDERDGYYCRRGKMRQGRGGDYRTAPETSPLFAATFAHYFMKSYFDLGAPQHWTIVEVGAGRGDFALGVLTSLQRNFPSVFAATRYVVDELSDDARAEVEAKLFQFKDRVEFRALSEIEKPFSYVIVFSNELLDAFPIHPVIGRGGNLQELRVGASESGAFIWFETELQPLVAEYCERTQLQLREGQIYEVNLEAENFVARAAALIERGYLITVDYGAKRNELLDDPNRFSGTLRSFQRHRIIQDVLSQPGEQDLTTTVDWTLIGAAGARAGLETLRFARLDEFLLGEGALAEIVSTGDRLGDQIERFNFNAAAREMIMPDGMAAHFQVLVQRKG
ncbi:MAG: class I SAM-dependent methyltransferase [Pyrinomonadaceae bacterium]